MSLNNQLSTNSNQYFVIRIKEEEFGMSRDAVCAELKKYNIFTRKYFYPLCSDYACYKHLPSANPALLPVASKAVKEVLSLPFYGALTEDMIDIICSNIESLCQN